MNKKLIAAALAALPAVSMADVTVYGTLSGGLQNDGITSRSSENRIDDYTSFIGFKGNEDLGNGLKTIWQVESRLHIDGTNEAGLHSQSDMLGSRQTFVGLEGDFGKIRLGRLNNALQDLGTVDPWHYNAERFSDPIFDANGNKIAGISRSGGANGLGTFTHTAGFLKNAIRYDSPDLMGFSAHIEYGLGENKREKITGNNARANDVLGLGINYAHSGFFGHYAYQKEYNPGSQANEKRHGADVQRVEVGYDENNLFVALGYQRTRGYDYSDNFSGDSGWSQIALAANGMPLQVNGVTVNIPVTTINGTKLANYIPSPAQRQLTAQQAALTAAYTIGPFTPRISYAKGWNQKDNIMGSINDSGYRQYVLGVDYSLSKRTSTGLSYGDIKWGKNTTQALQTAGWSAVTGDAQTNDTSVRTFGMHLTHSF